MLIVRFLLPLLAACLCAAAESAFPPPVVPEGLGANIHFTKPKPGELEMMAAAGLRWVRMDFGWEATEGERGKYDFSAYDGLVTALKQSQMRALFILDYGNHLYEKERSVRTEEGRQAYARWAAEAARHFRGRGVIWEIWNEPNGGFWSPHASVEEYAAMAVAASRAIRAGEPGATIIGPATAGIDFPFLEACGKAGLFALWDAISVHPYRQGGPEAVAEEYRKLRALISRQAPGRNLPIISGEWGYSAAWANFDAARQGRMLPREWLINLAEGIPLSIWYDWHDDGPDPKEGEHHFGLVTFPYHAGANPVYEPKPAYLAAKTLTTTLAQSRFVKRLAVGGVDDYVMLFQQGRFARLAIWTTRSEPHPLRIPAAAEKCTALDLHGEKLPEITAQDGTLPITATESVVYLVLAASDDRLASIPAAHPLRATLEPTLGAALGVRLENPTAAPADLQVGLAEYEGIAPQGGAVHVHFAAGETERTIELPLEKAPAKSFRAGLSIKDGAVLSVPAQTFHPVPPEALETARSITDGDAKVESEIRFTKAEPPAPLPSGPAPAMRLSYHFAKGWKFFEARPSGAATAALPGKPRAFGIWVYGDGRRGHPRLRVTDASGQTWQPAAREIDWTGWRFVHFELDPATSHWGGSKDGVIHYPLHWSSLFLFDRPATEEATGEIWISSPVVIE